MNNELNLITLNGGARALQLHGDDAPMVFERTFWTRCRESAHEDVWSKCDPRSWGGLGMAAAAILTAGIAPLAMSFSGGRQRYYSDRHEFFSRAGSAENLNVDWQILAANLKILGSNQPALTVGNANFQLAYDALIAANHSAKNDALARAIIDIYVGINAYDADRRQLPLLEAQQRLHDDDFFTEGTESTPQTRNLIFQLSELVDRLIAEGEV